MKLLGKNCVITGGSSGIGYATARRFAEEGASVYIISVDSAERLAEVKSILGSSLSESAVVNCSRVDISNWEDVHHYFSSTGGAPEHVDILVNSAGVWETNPLPDESPAVFQKMVNINLMGTYHCINACVPAMSARGEGVVVNVISLAGTMGLAGSSAYAASKGGAWMLTKTLASELAPQGIRVNGIAPGNVETPINEVVRSPGNEAVLEKYRQITPSGRLYSPPEDMASLALFLASAESAALHGTIIVADEGISASLPALE